MERYINLDVEKFANKLLNREERELIEDLEIDVCLDPECKQVFHKVCDCKKNSIDRIIQENKVINKFVALLEQDEEILAILI